MTTTTTRLVVGGALVGALTLAAGVAWAQSDGDGPAGPGPVAEQDRAGTAGRWAARRVRAMAGGEVTVRRGGEWVDVTFARGTLDAVDGTTLVITRADGDPVTVTVDGETRYRGVDGLDDLRTGAPVAVSGPTGEPVHRVAQPTEDQQARIEERRADRRAERAERQTERQTERAERRSAD